MPDQNIPDSNATGSTDSSTPVDQPTTDSPVVNVTATDDSLIHPDTEPVDGQSILPDSESQNELYASILSKINESQNVLIALSSDPTVDEMSAAIGLSLYLDRIGKRATAIYSGATPNALEFLKPEETFESTVDSLQDFVIAINKEKADHLRYKLDGDFVKIYITPYKTRISENDFDFSYGDFNVDLVLALNISNGIDLDSALREHGRIMHDASIINITNEKPGKFGEIEWSDINASSVSEMIARLLYAFKGDTKIESEEATAFLTGIVAATNRFSNAKTTSETMKVSSKLMESGADQQLVSQNITPEIENEILSIADSRKSNDPTKLNIEHEKGEESSEELDKMTEFEDRTEEKEEDTHSEDKEEPKEDIKEESKEKNESESASDLLDDLKAAEESLAHLDTETVPELPNKPVKIEEVNDQDPELPSVEFNNPSEPEATEPAPEPLNEENKIQPFSDAESGDPNNNEASKYGKMLENALSEIGDTNTTTDTPISSAPENPAAINAPEVGANPEINGVPEINYMPMPGEEILPPPPTPPISPDASIVPAAPTSEPTPTSLGPQPAMQDQVYNPQASDPSAFKIPGM